MRNQQWQELHPTVNDLTVEFRWQPDPWWGNQQPQNQNNDNLVG